MARESGIVDQARHHAEAFDRSRKQLLDIVIAAHVSPDGDAPHPGSGDRGDNLLGSVPVSRYPRARSCPARANCAAVAAPMPRLPPVIIVTGR